MIQLDSLVLWFFGSLVFLVFLIRATLVFVVLLSNIKHTCIG